MSQSAQGPLRRMKFRTALPLTALMLGGRARLAVLETPGRRPMIPTAKRSMAGGANKPSCAARYGHIRQCH
jgi:hypothetical protein